jgi:hypothetical protein
MVNHINDQRAQELNNLQLELASFAMRLDAFEARTKRRMAIPTPDPSELNLSDIRLAKAAVSSQ